MRSGARRWNGLVILVVAGFLLGLRVVLVPAEPSTPFPTPAVLRPNVEFWKTIFTELDSRSGVLHDAEDVTRIYHTFRNLPTHPHRRQRLVDRYRRRYQHILHNLARGKRRGLSRDERRVLRLFKGQQRRKVLHQAAHNLRFQLGLRDRFLEGLQRSGAYMPTITAILEAEGLPPELGWLPHVESSFNPYAHSKSGAAGMWQFTRSTGRHFMRIDAAIDERLDFRRATEAAGRLLRQNYQELGTWPLAITAYNHGVGGMKRAVKTLGTRDFGTIVQRYRSRTFGFASKNFYAEFLAVVEVVQQPHTYFPNLTFEPPQPVHAVTLDAYMSLPTLSHYLRIPPRELARWNPALKSPILRGQRLIPEGFVLYLPAERLSPRQVNARLARIPPSARFTRQPTDRKYRVRRGDSLSKIAQQHRTSVQTLMALNDLDKADLIRVGQTLRLPPPRTRRVAARRPAARQRAAAPETLAPQRQLPAATAAPDANLEFQLLMAGFHPHTQRTPGTDAWMRVHNGTIRVIASETLSLYAKWLKLPLRRLRALNRLPSNRPLALGSAIRLDFSRVSEAEFTRRRLQHHRRIEEKFFRAYAVDGVITHTLKPGETLWALAHHEYDVPLWLLQKYNHELEFQTLPPGTKLRIPQVIEKTS